MAGEDRWIAISCATAAEWQRLCTLAGLTGTLAPEVRDGAIAAWTAARTADALAAQLQATGIAASAVADIEDLIEHDPQLRARGALVTLDHPLLGAFGHVRTPMSFSRSRIEPFRAPGLGEHSREVAAGIAGLARERIEELEQLGVFV